MPFSFATIPKQQDFWRGQLKNNNKKTEKLEVGVAVKINGEFSFRKGRIVKKKISHRRSLPQ